VAVVFSVHDVTGAVLAVTDCPVRAHELLRELDDARTWRLPSGVIGGTKLRGQGVRSHVKDYAPMGCFISPGWGA
jgi:hypothetical protein